MMSIVHQMTSIVHQIHRSNFFQETRDEDLERLISAHCRLDLTSPMPGCTDNQRRHLLFEGDLKLKEGSTKVLNNYCKESLIRSFLIKLCSYFLESVLLGSSSSIYQTSLTK